MLISGAEYWKGDPQYARSFFRWQHLGRAQGQAAASLSMQVPWGRRRLRRGPAGGAGASGSADLEGWVLPTFSHPPRLPSAPLLRIRAVAWHFLTLKFLLVWWVRGAISLCFQWLILFIYFLAI